jgi:beta-glucosidase
MGCSALGPSKVYVDEQMIFNITRDCDDPMAFILAGVEEGKAQFHFTQGQEYRIRVRSLAPATEPNDEESFNLLAGLLGIHLGFMRQNEFEEDLLTAAVEVAKSADVALIFVGNTPAWETEGT